MTKEIQLIYGVIDMLNINKYKLQCTIFCKDTTTIRYLSIF